MQISHPLQNYNKNSLIKVSYKGGGWALGNNTYPTSTLSRVRTNGRTDGRTKQQLYAPPILDRGAYKYAHSHVM